MVLFAVPFGIVLSSILEDVEWTRRRLRCAIRIPATWRLPKEASYAESGGSSGVKFCICRECYADECCGGGFVSKGV